MRRILAWPVAVAAVFGLVCPVLAGDGHEGHDHAQMDMEAMMQEYMEKYASPGPEHQELQYFAGNWTYVSTNYWGPEAMKTEGVVRGDLMLGGRYLHAVHSGDMNGMPFEGVGITAYDRVGKKWINYWFDNMGTGCMESEGTLSKDGKKMLWTSDYMDPMQGMTKVRMVSEIQDDDHYTFDMYMRPEGQDEVKSMEIRYTRKKSS